MKSRVLFICKARNTSYGISYGLLNSCKFVGEALKEAFCGQFEYKVVSVADNNGIDKVVSEYKPTHVMIEALWVVPEKFDVLLQLYPEIEWNVRIHSKAPFLANEGIAFDWMNRYEDIKSKYSNFSMSTNDFDFSDDLSIVMGEYAHLPNIYVVDKKFTINTYDNHPDVIDIGCFGAIRPMKNQLEQAIAAIIFAETQALTLRFHMNSGRSEQKGDQAMNNIIALFEANPDHTLVLHGWMDHEHFTDLVRTMDLGMQVSFSESFNIVTADFVKFDIPIIVSHDITWMSRLYKSSATNTESIVNKLKFAYKFRKFNLQYLNKLSLNNYNHLAISSWASYLGLEDH